MATITTNGIYPGTRLSLKEKTAQLYHYTSFDSFVKIWLTSQLKFAEITKMNDLQEASINVSTYNHHCAPLLQAYYDVRSKYKQISLTMSYDSYFKGCMSPMMWGLYADKRNGVCIELDYSKLKFPKGVLKSPITYKQVLQYSTILPENIHSIQDIKKYIQRNAKKIFFTKQNSWKGENEFRIVSPDLDFLDITDAISAVYLSSYNSLECKLVEKLVNGKVPVKFIYFFSGENGLSIPDLKDTREYRELQEEAATNKENIILKIQEQADEYYEKHKHDETKDLRLFQYNFGDNS